MFLSASAQQITGAGGKATVNGDGGTVTTEALATAAGAVGSYTINCNQVTSKSLVLVTMSNGTNNAGDPDLTTIKPADNGTITLGFINRHGTNALNGSLKFSFVVFN